MTTSDTGLKAVKYGAGMYRVVDAAGAPARTATGEEITLDKYRDGRVFQSQGRLLLGYSLKEALAAIAARG